MIEAEWLACPDPRKMLADIGGGKAGNRELRLFAVACCRLVAINLTAEALAAIDAHEAFADDLIDEATLVAAIENVERSEEVDGRLPTSSRRRTIGRIDPWAPWLSQNILRPMSVAEWTSGVTRSVSRDRDRPEPRCVSWKSYSWVDRGRRGRSVHPYAADSRSIKGMKMAQADLLREIFGNPFRPSTFDPAWLTWDGGTVPDFARAMYESKGFDRMPILADALEEAGCADAEILAHCRGGGTHVRGCWVVDSLLGLG